MEKAGSQPLAPSAITSRGCEQAKAHHRQGGGERSGFERELRRRIASVLEVDPDRIAAGTPLAGLGFDSLGFVELQHQLKEWLGAAPPLVDLIEKASLASLADELWPLIEASPAPPGRQLPAGEAAGELALSFGQQAIWFLERLAPGSGSYHIAGAATVGGALDRGALARSLRALSRRHAALRTVFAAGQGEPRQRVLPDLDPELRWLDAVRPGAGEAGTGALERILREEAGRPFDLARGPLLRMSVVAQGAGEPQAMVLAVHHLVADFWSMAVLVRELGRLYRQETGGPPADLAPLPAAYADFVRWQREWVASPAGERALAFWRETLREAPPLSLATDRPRPAVQGHRGGAVRVRLEAATTARLQETAARRGATPFMTLLAAYRALLHRYGAADGFAIGCPAAGRRLAAFAPVVGYFVNPLPVRAALHDGTAFTGLLDRVRRAVLDAFEHQDLPLPLMVEALQPERDASRSPLFQAMLVWQKADRAGEEALAAFALGEGGARLDLGGLALTSLAWRPLAAQMDLSLTGAMLGETWSLGIEYAADLFDRATAARMLRHLGSLLRQAAAEPLRPIDQLPLLCPEERAQALVEWSDTGAETPPASCLHDLFAAQAARAPEALALVWGEWRLSYGELDRRANRLARHLRARGAGPEVRVALMVERSPELVIAALGILMAGAAFVPLDPAWPAERRAFMLADSGAALLVAGERQLPPPSGFAGAVVCLEREAAAIASRPAAPSPPAAAAGNLAYVIYTSGSTGRPKGVAVEHRSPVVLVHWARQAFSAAELGAVLASTSICFDLAIFELFAPLAWGGAVILAEDLLALSRRGAAAQPTLVNTVPSLLGELLRRQPLPACVRTVCLAGEPLPAALVRQLSERGAAARILNLYGPTEDTTYSTLKEVRDDGRAPTLGRPLWRTRAQVLDRHLEPVPPGVAGELFLGGAGLARGYLGRPELTAERFVPDPRGGIVGEPGARLYRTGDVVRQLADGELDYLGRADHQVKLRGYRIELGEVEATLLRHPAVRQAAALVRRDGPACEPRLVAYVAAGGSGGGEAGAVLRRELAGLLRAALPAPMVPAAIVVLGELPLTANGKIERRALPAPAADTGPSLGAPPRTPAEELLAGILAEALGIEAMAPDADFFALGGHSLLAVRVTSRIESCFGVELPLAALFQHPTAAALAELLAGRGAAGTAPAPPITAVPRAGPLAASFAQQRLWLVHQLAPLSPAYHLAGELRLNGELRPAALAAALAALVDRHEALRAAFPDRGGEPALAISPAGGRVPLPRIDLGGLPEPVRRLAAAAAGAALARRPFDLERGPLLRLALIVLAPREHRLVTVFHHVAADGVSLGIFLRELATLYPVLAAGGPASPWPLPPLPVQYADFAAWQRRVLTAAALAGPLAWWRQRLASLPPPELPADRAWRPGGGDAGGSVALVIAAGAAAAELRAACRAAGATPYMALAGGLLALLARLGRASDLAVGTLVDGRNRLELEGLVGLFVNTVVLRLDLGGDPPAAELLARVRRAVLEAHAAAEVPFERVVEELRTGHGLDEARLLEVMFSHLQGEPLAARLPGLELAAEEIETGAAKFPLSLWVRDGGDALAGKLVYQRQRFDRATVARLAGGFRALVQGLVRRPDLPLSELPLLSAAERHQLLVEWSAGQAAAGAGAAAQSDLGELLAARAAAAPDAPAVLAGDGEDGLDFRELNRRANRLARRLRTLGVGPEALVGVSADRSPEMVVAVFGIWKAGAAYLPLDPSWPAERLRAMVAEAGAPVLIARSEQPDLAGGGAAIRVDMAELALPGTAEDDAGVPVAAAAENLAYVLYTSGSTGRPKGVMVRRGAVANLAAALAGTCYREGARLRVGLNASLAFDASVKQLVQVLDGHALCVLPEAVRRDPERLAAFLAARRPDVIDCTPSQLHLLLDAAPGVAPAALAAGPPAAGTPASVLLGGEAVAEDLWRELAARPAPRFWNLYGPTECTVDATAGRVAGNRPVLGRPLAGVQVYVLDRWLWPVPAGAPGEIWIGGAGLARGYWRRPDLTALHFLPNPFGAAPGERLYRSGDLGRFLSDGTLEFLGRVDEQLKVRGFRVEPGEVAAVLRRHPAVAQAAVVLREQPSGEARLVAYYAAGSERAEGSDGEEAATAAELRELLRRELPEPMIPSAFVRLPRLPLSPSGKLDRAALPLPPLAPAGAYVAPRTQAERQLAELWAGLLGRERVGVRDSFFELGGHSLLAAQLASRIRQGLGVELPLRQLLETPTVEAQAAALEKLRQGAPPPAVAAIRARPRSGRDLSQLVEELEQLSDAEIARRLRRRPAPPGGAR